MLNAHVQACAFAHVRLHSLSFDDCVEQGGPDCDPKKMWLQVTIIDHPIHKIFQKPSPLSSLYRFFLLINRTFDWHNFACWSHIKTNEQLRSEAKDFSEKMIKNLFTKKLIFVLPRFLSSVVPLLSAGNQDQSGLWRGQRWFDFNLRFFDGISTDWRYISTEPKCASIYPSSETSQATLAEHYLLVGQTEDMASMYQVLELVIVLWSLTYHSFLM